MKPNYNKIASIYDALTFIVFGNSLKKARAANLHYIREKDRILIVGGGTGQVISDLNKLNKELEVDFIDISEKMIGLAQKRNQNNIKVKYHQADILSFMESEYDIVICNFFLDQFSTQNILLILRHLKSKLKLNGLFLYSDFQPTKNYANRLMVHLMYIFFRVSANLEKVILAEHKILFEKVGFKHASTITSNMNIFITIYRK